MTTSISARAQLTRAIEQNGGDVLRYLERRLGADDAADALVEVMIVTWRRLDSLPDEAEQARMWLFGIARNVVANGERGERRRRNLAERLRVTMAAAPTEAPPADEGLEVRDAIARLAPEQAELVRLIHWEGFTIAEAGAILDVAPSTARTRYQRARADLKSALADTPAEKHRA